jgi:cold shock protein
MLIFIFTRFIMATGTVKWFNSTKGYGFIAPNDGANGGKDVFVHIKAVQDSGMGTLSENQNLQFEIKADNKGRMSAVELRSL